MTKSYRGKSVLNVDELTLLAGRLYILMGANGSGKSTLLNILAFLMRPDGGDIVFEGEPVTWKKPELNALRRRVTLLHQFPYLFGGTVFSNVAFGLKLRDVAGEKLQQAVADSLALVGLSGFEERHVRQLSGGEGRRVAIARALAIAPHILLLDEPLANVDEDSARVIESLIASLPGRGITVVMSTHDLHQGDRMEATTIRLCNGRLDLPKRTLHGFSWEMLDG
ncbi:MAG: energy-coupling factor ABC transporter ATP-binding protein [Terriglobales bacterium]